MNSSTSELTSFLAYLYVGFRILLAISVYAAIFTLIIIFPIPAIAIALVFMALRYIYKMDEQDPID